MPHPSLTIFDPQLHQAIRTDFQVTVLRNDCSFSEGPVWSPEGWYLFSDIPRNEICRIDASGNHSVYLKPSGCFPGNRRHLSEQTGSNGLAYDCDGRLLVCQHGEGAVARYDGNGLEPFIMHYNGKPFNSPNDIACAPDGSIYFSDPPYGLKNQQPDEECYQPVAGVYCWRDNALQLVTSRYRYPNGVCLSPDGRKLYTCSSKPFEAALLQFDTQTLAWEQQLADTAADGIKCDPMGNLFLCTKEGILILSAAGKPLGRIQFETIPANCCFGGATGLDLLVTARQHIFLISDLLRGG